MKHIVMTALVCCFFNSLYAQMSAYDSLVAKVRGEISPTAIVKTSRAVMLYRDSNFCGMGTFHEDENIIVTAGHIFLDSAKQSHRYTAELFQPSEGRMLYVTSVEIPKYRNVISYGDTVNCTRDVSICYVSDLMKDCKPIWGKYPMKLYRSKVGCEFRPTEETYLWDLSAHTTVPVMCMVLYQTPDYYTGWSYVVDQESYSGKSGAGYLASKNGVNLVLSESLVLINESLMDENTKKAILNLKPGKKYTVIVPVNAQRE